MCILSSDPLCVECRHLTSAVLYLFRLHDLLNSQVFRTFNSTRQDSLNCSIRRFTTTARASAIGYVGFVKLFNACHQTSVRPIPTSGIGQYLSVSVSADTYFSIGANTSSWFTCLNSQHCCTHACNFKPTVCFILRNRFLQLLPTAASSRSS